MQGDSRIVLAQGARSTAYISGMPLTACGAARRAVFERRNGCRKMRQVCAGRCGLSRQVLQQSREIEMVAAGAGFLQRSP